MKIWEMTREQKIQDMVIGLRKLASFIEKNADLIEDNYAYFGLDLYTDSKEKIKDAAQKMRGAKKEYNESMFILSKRFSETCYFHVRVSRSEVCERVVIGTREIPERILPARTEEI